MRWVQQGAAGTITFDLPSRPSGAGTARVVNAGGAELTTPTPSLNSVNTTTSTNAAAGATGLTLTSGTGVTAGRRYLLGGSEDVGGERVLVAAVSGAAVTLARPLSKAVASGATFQSSRIEVAVSTACTATVARQHRVEWTDPTSGEVLPYPFDVTRYAPRSSLTSAELLDLDPSLRKRLASGTWLPAVIERAWEQLLFDLASKERHPGGFAGVVELTTAHGYLVRALVADTDASEDGRAYRDDMRERYAQERERALTSVAYDDAGTGAAVPGAGTWVGFTLVRG